ncbi:MAG: hypothetical protein LBU64_06320 [Planctomycetota bacterium]|nr:hypothetical protein [Planctomycetota bacterium]
MRSVKILWFLFSLLFAFPAGCLAGEFGAAAPEAIPEEAAPETAADGGSEAVYAAQVGPGAAYVADVAAEEQIREYADSKGWREGWDEARKRMFVVQFSAFNTDDPRSDRNFLVKREMAAKQAALQGKSDIIRFINSDLSAMDQIDVPGTDLYAALNQEYEAVSQRIEAQRKNLVRLLAEVDTAEARALDEATTRDRVNALIEAAIKRLDGEFDAGALEEARRNRYEDAKRRYQEANAEYEALRRKAEALRGEASGSFASAVTVRAKMPLIGASVIQQAESWSEADRQYQVAVLLCWSAELEKSARAALSGLLPEGDAKAGGQSLAEWLAGQDLSAMVGPRQFLDAEGQRHFLGVTARPAARDAALDRNNRAIADLFASQMAIFSLFADVDSFAEARQLAQTRSSGDLEQVSDVAVAETLSLLLTQKFENMKVQGLSPVLRKRVRHAITGQDMHVSVFGISPKAAATAMKLERRAALSALAFNQEQAFAKARGKALAEAVTAAKRDPAAIRAGELAGRAELEAVRSRAAGASASAPAGAAGGRSASGSIMSGEAADDF